MDVDGYVGKVVFDDRKRVYFYNIFSKVYNYAVSYTHLMDVTSGIPYISETLSKDVTAEVKAQLNKTTK